ncbi:hypothetical protein EJB05_00762, partial [Eragrostis curvula]
MSDLNDDMVDLILERIGSHVSLIRAASTCKRWRRVIANAAFLRRYRSLHAATVAGAYYNHTPMQGPVFVPSPSIPIDGRRHSLGFLPHHGKNKSWAVVDSRETAGFSINVFYSRIDYYPCSKMRQSNGRWRVHAASKTSCRWVKLHDSTQVNRSTFVLM